jgi:hypothetical protein
MTFELIKKMLTRPQEAFREIREDKPIYASVLYLLIFGVVWYLFSYFSLGYITKDALNALPQNLKDIYSTVQNFVSVYSHSEFLLVFSLVLPFINTFFSVAVYNLLSEFAIKKSDGITLFISWSFASSPILLERVLALLYESIFKAPMPSFISVIFIFWGIYLYILAIKQTYEVSFNIASLLFFFPIILTVLVLVYIAYFVSSLSAVSIILRSFI